MTLIEGIGDEVTLVFAALLVILVGMFAWLSTHTSDIPFFRVLFVELTRRHDRSPSPEDSGETTDNSGSTESESQATETTEPGTGGLTEEDSQGEVTVAESPPETENLVASEEEHVNQTNSPQGTENVEMASCRQRRLEYFSDSKQTRSETQTIEGQGTQPPERQGGVFDGQPENKTLVVDSSSVSVEAQSSSDSQRRQSETAETVETLDLEDGNIRVKLKYLDERLRLVQTNPSETIGQFKRNHFASELASNKLVRLIFNGQCLQNEASTLQSYNIQDNCTVHCLVTEARQAEPVPSTEDMGNIDLGFFMIPAFALVLATIWYFRFMYRQYFNAMSTLSLIGITFLFSIALLSTWRTRHNRDEHQHLE